jgi:hypothetical protein
MKRMEGVTRNDVRQTNRTIIQKVDVRGDKDSSYMDEYDRQHNGEAMGSWEGLVSVQETGRRKRERGAKIACFDASPYKIKTFRVNAQFFGTKAGQKTVHDSDQFNIHTSPFVFL